MTTATEHVSSVGQGSVEIPRSLFGYEVLDLIGAGAGSLIYAVADPRTHQIYAMKHVRKRKERDERYFEQLQVEYDVSSQFTHAALRRTLDLRDNRTLFRKATEAAMVMELFDGTPLEVRRPNDVVEIMDCFIRAAQGLVSMHAMGYVHCDLKPNNILIGAEGEVKVIDFGQSCRPGTVKERVQGTPDFMAPEQVKCQPITVKTDVFNMGATLYWTLAGRSIPTLYTLKRTENSFLVDDQLPSPRHFNPSVPETLSNLVMECVRSNPAKRPNDMHELLHRLEIVRHGIVSRGMAVA